MDCEHERGKQVDPMLDESMFIVLANAFSRTERLLTATTIPVPVLRRLPVTSASAKEAMRRLVDSLAKMMAERWALEVKDEATGRRQSRDSLVEIYGSEWSHAQCEALGAFRLELAHE